MNAKIQYAKGAFIFLVFLLSTTVASAGSLNQAIHTPNHGYKVKYHDKDPDDIDFFPKSRAQDVADALDNTLTPITGFPNGHHDGLIDRGFREPHFNGNNKVEIEHIEDETGEGPVRGIANYNKIVINTGWASGNSDGGMTESCLRKVTGHELFHHTEFAYMSKSKLYGWSDFLIEGMARAMEDKIYLDIDAGACNHYINEVASIQSNPNAPLWGRDYDAALFWNYLAEQYGVENTEPHVGIDFFTRFWQNAADEDSNLLANLIETLADFNETTPLEEIFRDYTLANVAREFDLTPISNADRYRYIDEQPPLSSNHYKNVAKISAAFPITSSTDVPFWSAEYITVNVPTSCTGVVGFSAESGQGELAGFNLLGIKNNVLERLEKGTLNTTLDNSFAVAFPYDPNDPWKQLIAVIQGFDGGTVTNGAVSSLDLMTEVDFTFDCGPATLNILTPTGNLPAWVGDNSNPDRFNVIVSINGPASLGDAFVEGLDSGDFTVYVGDPIPQNEATVLSGREAGGLFTLTVEPPVKTSGIVFPLTVNYGAIASATNDNAVRYEPLVIDEIVLFDRSGSMNSPAGDPKLLAARAIGRMDINSAQLDDQISVVSFNGNGFLVEPSTTATVEFPLTPVDGSSRPAAIVAMNSLLANGATSIGDGLFVALQEIAANGVADGEDWIVLLSDGAENEARFYANVHGNLVASGARVFAIAFGGHADQPLLQRIAEDSNGAYMHVPLGGSSRSAGSGADMTLDLADAFITARSVMRKHDRLFEARDTGSNTHAIEINGDGISAGRFVLQWNSDAAALDLVITRPDGSVVTDGVDGATVLTDSQHVVAHVPSVEAGAWSVSTNVVSGSADYLLTLTGKSRDGVQLEIDFDQDDVDPIISAQGGNYQRGLPMRIIGVVTDSKGPVLNAAVTASVNHPESGSTALSLHDDGKHNDGKADDGVYANVYAAVTDGSATSIADNPAMPQDNGSFIVTVTAEGSDSLGNSFTRISKGAFSVLKPDGAEDDDFDGMVNAFENRFGCLRSGFNDAIRDEDNDGLTNVEEYLQGTDPCNADTDQGGENDGSEVARGSNPLDRSDDALRRPLEVGVVKARGDAVQVPDVPVSGNLIRYPASPGYASIEIYASPSAAGPFNLIANFAPATHGGLYRHNGVPNGVTAWYFVIATDQAGNRSAPSRLFNGTPNADPVAPAGLVSIANGQSVINVVDVELHLSSSSDTVQMLVSNLASFDDVTPIPYSETLNWTLEPDRDSGMAHVFVRFIDAAGNRSLIATSGIRVDQHAVFGSISGTIDLGTVANPAGVLISLADQSTLSPVLSDSAGVFSLGNVPPGTYDVSVQRNGYLEEEITSVTVTANTDTPLGVIVLTGIDSDGDGVLDPFDNCQLHANSDQTDSDNDLVGNRCDPDISPIVDCYVNLLDLAVFRDAFSNSLGDPDWNPHADFNADNNVNFQDFAIMRDFAFQEVGPSGYASVCE